MFFINESANSSIINKIKNTADMYTGTPASAKAISDAEKELGIKFPKEYKDILSNFGNISFGAHEWTGLNTSNRLNVVYATKKERQLDEDFPKNYFVLEDYNIDTAIAVVNSSGEVYAYKYKLRDRLAKNIGEYLNKELKQ